MRRAVVILAVALALGSGGCRREPQVTGFMEVPWGATRAQLVAKLGKPQSETPWPGGALSLVFPRRNVLDEPAEPRFVVTRDGMVQGGYTVWVVEFPYRCQQVYRSYVDAVSTRFPGLKPKTQSDGVAPDAPSFCVAAAEGRAGMQTEWSDPANGARITVSIWRGEQMVRVAYQSAAGRRWSRMTSDSSLKKDF